MSQVHPTTYLSVFSAVLRIDNRRQSVVCGIFLSSLAIARILTYYT